MPKPARRECSRQIRHGEGVPKEENYMVKKIIFVLILGLCALCGACAKNTRENYVAYYPQCQQPILDMQSRGTAGGAAAKGAVGGGIVGGATGFFLGLLLNGGNAANAGIGAAVGGATGALSGGISGAMRANSGSAEENRLLARYYEQIDGDISGLDLPQAAGTVALQCYKKKLAEVEEMEKSGAFTAQSIAARKSEIEQGMAQARQLIGPSATNSQQTLAP